MINWKVRVKSKAFWLALIPAVLLLVQCVAALFGYQFDFEALQGRLLDIVNAVFLVLTILGIVVDPTTAGWSDSSLAMTYATPRVSDEATDLAMQQAILDTSTFKEAA